MTKKWCSVENKDTRLLIERAHCRWWLKHFAWHIVWLLHKLRTIKCVCCECGAISCNFITQKPYICCFWQSDDLQLVHVKFNVFRYFFFWFCLLPFFILLYKGLNKKRINKCRIVCTHFEDKHWIIRLNLFTIS